MSKVKIVGTMALGSAAGLAGIAGVSTSAYASTMPSTTQQTVHEDNNSSNTVKEHGTKVTAVNVKDLQNRQVRRKKPVDLSAQSESQQQDISQQAPSGTNGETTDLSSSDSITTIYKIVTKGGKVLVTKSYTDTKGEKLQPPPQIPSGYELVGFNFNGHAAKGPDAFSKYMNDHLNHFNIIVQKKQSGKQQQQQQQNTNSDVKLNEVHVTELSNGSVSFSIYNPNAKSVTLKTSYDGFKAPITMKKNSKGYWEVNVNFNGKYQTGKLDYKFFINDKTVLGNGVPTTGTGNNETDYLNYINKAADSTTGQVQLKAGKQFISNFKDCKFEILNNDNQVVGKLKVGDNGVSNTITLKDGTYKLVETTPAFKGDKLIKPTSIKVQGGTNIIELGVNDVKIMHKGNPSQTQQTQKDFTTTIRFEYNGKITFSIQETGVAGSKFTKKFVLPEGYIISKILVDGKPYTGTTFPDTIGNQDETITYVLVKATPQNIQKYKNINNHQVIQHYEKQEQNGTNQNGSVNNNQNNSFKNKVLHNPYYSDENMQHRGQVSGTSSIEQGNGNSGLVQGQQQSSNISGSGNGSITPQTETQLPHTGLDQTQVMEYDALNVAEVGAVMSFLIALLSIFGIKIKKQEQ